MNYNDSLDNIINQCLKERTSFDYILENAQGASPLDIKKRLKILLENGTISKEKFDQLYLFKKSEGYRERSKTIVSHMLDSDWKFNQKGIDNILSILKSKINNLNEKKIAFIGCPSLFYEFNKENLGNKRVLFDRNAEKYNSLLLDDKKEELLSVEIPSNISMYEDPNNSFDIVLMDPPWYYDAFLNFMRFGYNMLKVKGVMFYIFPQNLTRPSIKDELSKLKIEIDKMGLKILQVFPAYVTYTTPFFEECVLEKNGINLESIDWRYADLYYIEKEMELTRYSFTATKLLNEWEEIVVANTRYKIRNIEKNDDVFLSSPFKDNFLPSFSKRDFLKELESINVWTSSNHVYSCGDIELFKRILSCLASNSYSNDNILSIIQKEYPKYCIDKIKCCLEETLQIHYQEIEEYRIWISKYNKHINFIISDFDGTIKEKESEIKNLDLLKEFSSIRNTGLILCTGRNFDYVRDYFNLHKIRVDYYICSNGSIIYDGENNCIYRSIINEETKKNIERLFQEEKKEGKITAHSDSKITRDLNEDVSLICVKINNPELVNYYIQELYPNKCFYDNGYLLITENHCSKENAISNLEKLNILNFSYIGDSEADKCSIKKYNGYLIGKNKGFNCVKDFATFCNKAIIENELLSSLIKNKLYDLYEKLSKTKKFHLAIFTEPFITYIKSGKKTIESRFSINRIVPYETVQDDDVIFIKKSSGFVEGYFVAGEVKNLVLDERIIIELKTQFSSSLCVDKEFWEAKSKSKYCTLIEIKQYKELNKFSITKRGMQSWISFKKEKN